jgi:hypothetical protein
MTTKNAPLGLRLFLEGIEVPVISAQVDSSPDQPAVASIQIVPTDTALNLLARTYVSLFYLGDTTLSMGGPISEVTSEDNSNRFDAADEKYRLLFCGEVIGINYGKDPGTRQLVLQCMDLSSYWDTAYQWFTDYSPDGNMFSDKRKNFVAAGEGTFDSVSGGHQWVIGEVITTKPRSADYRNTKGLLGGIIHVLEAISGIRYLDGANPGFNGVNDFFTIAELRYNLMGMLGAVEKDDTSAKLYASRAFISWLRNGMMSMGTMLSFRDIINHICQMIFHNIYPNTCPYYVESKGPGIKETWSPGFFDDQIGVAVKNSCKAVVEQLTASYNSFVNTNSRDELAVATMKLSESSSALVKIQENTSKSKSSDKNKVMRTLKEATLFVDDAYALASQEGFAQSVGQSQVVKETQESVVVSIQTNISSAVTLLKDGVIGFKSRASLNKKITSPSSPSRMYTQLLLPESFWVSPPRCNVIFPDQYFQLSYSRNLMREVSRLCLTAGPGWIVGSGRGSEHFNTSYYSPSIKDVKGNLFGASMAKGSKTLLPHELHSGIIPKFEWVTDGHRWAAKALKDGGSESGTGRVGYLQRLANFNFYLHRWAARSMNVSCVFNPHLVLGLPALVINTSMPAAAVVTSVEKVLGVRWRPSQFLGKIVSISHSITQGGASTSASLAYCRTQRGIDDEFLGMLLREPKSVKDGYISYKVDVQRLTNRSVSTVSDVRIVTVPGITKPVSTENELDLTLDYLSGALTTGGIVKGIPPFNGFKLVGSSEAEEKTKLSHSEIYSNGISETTWNALVVAGLVQNDVAMLPTSIEFKFQSPVKYGERVTYDTSIEDALMPGWYSDVWKNKNITAEVYKPLLGTSAITDAIMFPESDQAKALSEEVISGLESEKGKKLASTRVASKDSVGVVPGSVEEAVDSITFMYSIVKNKGQNMHEFIREYTERPVATLVQVLGSADLEFDDKGLPNKGAKEGFHSRAFGDYNADVRLPNREGLELQAGKDALKALFPGLTPSEVASLKRKAILNPGKDGFSISPEMDPRGKARKRVRAYVAELSISRGLSG